MSLQPYLFSEQKAVFGVGGGEVWFSRRGGHPPVFCGIGMVLDPGCVSTSPTYQKATLYPVDTGEKRVCSLDARQKPTCPGLGLGNPHQH